MRNSCHLMFWASATITLASLLGILAITGLAQDMCLQGKVHLSVSSAPNLDAATPFYGLHYVSKDDLQTVRELGVEVVLEDFEHDGSPESWLAYLDEAQAQGVRIVAWLWPEGWLWDGTGWQIDNQARLFVQTVAGHPALLAVYSLHEPYWNGCAGCGYTTAQQQALYDEIKAIADVPIYSAIGSVAFWTAQGEETAFADGVCDYCDNWYYPFREGDVYEREVVTERLMADLAVAKARAPNSKFVWGMQSFAQGPPFNLRMPDEDEMRDLASIVYSMDIDGALWYPWWFGDLYSDFLSNHPELYPVVQEVYQEYVLPAKYACLVYLPTIRRSPK